MHWGEPSGKCLDLKVNNVFKWQGPRKIRVDKYNIIFSQPYLHSVKSKIRGVCQHLKFKLSFYLVKLNQVL